ncbi:hypothetical protein [Indioceanicola profundi]|uniref:hypothetical protein n=1 Tax=Indioceanicola profundi TaxID=2220096 RepID=UPI0013C40970
MEQYAGIDVSLELSSVCVVEAKGRVVRETKVAALWVRFTMEAPQQQWQSVQRYSIVKRA